MRPRWNTLSFGVTGGPAVLWFRLNEDHPYACGAVELSNDDIVDLYTALGHLIKMRELDVTAKKEVTPDGLPIRRRTGASSGVGHTRLVPGAQADVLASADDEDLWSRVTMVPSPELGRTNEEASSTTLDAGRTVHSQVEEPTMLATRRAHESLVPELTAQQLQPEDPVISALFGDRPSLRSVEEARV